MSSVSRALPMSPPPRDAPRWLSIGLPLGSAAGCLAIARLDGPFYESWIAAKETGYVELATVLLLVHSGCLSARLWFQLRGTSNGALMIWLAVLFAGTVFWAGEEVSWGQHLVGWSTPELWQELNEQHETNLHNVHNVAFDTVPRLVLLLASVACVFVAAFPLQIHSRWPGHGRLLNWFLPTMASVPAALAVIALFILDGLQHVAPDTLTPWLRAAVMRNRIWELQEHFLTILLFLYLASWHTRWMAQRRGLS